MSRGIGAVEAASMLLAGLLIGLKTRPNLIVCGICCLVFTAAGVFFYTRGKAFRLDQPVKKLSRFFICLAILTGGMTRAAIPNRNIAENAIERYAGTGPITFTGTVIRPPVASGSRVSVRLELDDRQAYSGKVLLVFYHKPDQEFQYGDRLEVRGSVTLPPDTGSGFSYKTYLERDGVTALINNPTVELRPGFNGSYLLAGIYSLRKTLVDRVFQLFPAPENALMAGILLGDESKITSAIEHDFQKSGTAHIIAISGANFTVLTWLLLAILRRVVHRWWAPALMLPFIVFYTVLVGGNSAVVRAAIMCGLSIIGSCVGRNGNGVNNLAMTAAVMGIVRPVVLTDLGFQLSVTATLGILIFSNPLRGFTRNLIAKVFPKISEETLDRVVDVFNDLCLMSVSAQILTVWISAQAFGRISLISLPANLLIAPFQSVIMLGGFLSLMLSFLFYPLGAAAAWLVWAAPALTIRIVQLCARARWASVYADIESWQAWLLILLILLLYIFRTRFVSFFRKRDFRPYAVLLLGFAAVLIWVNALDRSDGRIRIAYSGTNTSSVLKVQSPAKRAFIIGQGLTNYAAQELLEEQIFPVRVDNKAAWLDIQEDWMVCEFQNSAVSALPDILYVNGISQEKGADIPSRLENGFALEADGLEIEMVVSYLGKRTWLVGSGAFTVLFPNGVPPTRIFKPSLLSEAGVSLIVLGKQDDSLEWRGFFADRTGTPQLFDSAERGQIVLHVGEDIITYEHAE